MATEAAGQYGTLKVGEGWLVRQTAIDAETSAQSAAYADDEIDDLFSDWNRSTWSASGPSSINRIWLQFATADYLDKVHATGNPQTEENHHVLRLKREANELAQRVIDDGGPKVNGQVQTKDGAADSLGGNRSVELWVT